MRYKSQTTNLKLRNSSYILTKLMKKLIFNFRYTSTVYMFIALVMQALRKKGHINRIRLQFCGTAASSLREKPAF